MNRCSPVEMRKNLEAVDVFRKAGIDFVAVPVKDDDHKINLINNCKKILNDMLNDSELSA